MHHFKPHDCRKIPTIVGFTLITERYLTRFVFLQYLGEDPVAAAAGKLPVFDELGGRGTPTIQAYILTARAGGDGYGCA